MAEIFISYKSERRKAAEHLAEVLKHHGYSVWFDYELIKGDDFRSQIEAQIRDAKAMVVLWCAMSVGSRWVREEAGWASQLGKLVPVKIEACELPFGFAFADTIDMTAWDGAPRGYQLDPLIRALAQRIGRAPNLDFNGLWEYEATWRRFGAPSLKAFALGAPLLETARPAPVIEKVSSPQVPVAAVNEGGELIRAAAQEWPGVRDSRSPQRLARFERHFAGTWYAEEARELRETIEAEARQRAEEQKFRAEGRIAVQVGDRAAATTQWLKPGGGEPFCDLAGGPEMVVVPAGRFEMGSPDDEPERESWQKGIESPRHPVTIARAFAVGRHAVTRGQFGAFVAAKGYKTDGGAYMWTGSEWKLDPKASWRDPGFRQDDDHPVVCVNWDDAKAYVAWLAELTGKAYRLLAEAEWEYAARAGTDTPFWWGRSITPAQANYDGNYVYEGGGSKGEYRKATVPVGHFAANPWGLYNVHGNVWEWCEDVWHDSYEGAPPDGTAWTTGDSSRRVVRGGSWNNYPGLLRAAARGRDSDRNLSIGFRLGRTLTS